MANYIETYTGRAFCFANPRPEDVDPRDVAHGLAMKCRFNGQTQVFYSVAQHSVLLYEHVRRLPVDPYVSRSLLIHDAAEAYLPDVPRPIKQALVGFKEMEDRVSRAVYRRFGLATSLLSDPVVKGYDVRILADERLHVMGQTDNVWDEQDEVPLGIDIFPWCWRYAEHRFLECLREAFPGVMR